MNRKCLLAFCICILEFKPVEFVILKFALITEFLGKFEEACGKIRSNPVSVILYVKSSMNSNTELKFCIIFSLCVLYVLPDEIQMGLVDTHPTQCTDHNLTACSNISQILLR